MFRAALSRHALKPAARLVTPGAKLAVDAEFILSGLNTLLDVLDTGPGA